MVFLVWNGDIEKLKQAVILNRFQKKKTNRQLFNKKLKIDSVEAIYLSNAGYKAVRAFTIDKGNKNKMMKDLNGTTVWLGALAAYQLLK